MRSSTSSPSRRGMSGRVGHPHAVALEHPAPVGEVDRRELDRPRRRCTARCRARSSSTAGTPGCARPAVAAVVEVPQLGPLVLRVPLAEVVAEAEHPLLGPGLLLVAAGTAEDGVEALLLDASQQGDGLQPVAAGPRPGLLAPSARRRCRPARWPRRGGRRPAPPSRSRNASDLGEVVAGVDVHHRERAPGRAERLHGQVQHDDRVLAAGEQQHRALELGRHLADDVDRLGLEGAEVGELVGGGHGTDHGKSRPDW